MSNNNPVSPLVRTALFVSDLTRSVRFYRDFLGLEAQYLNVTDLSASSAMRLLRFPETARMRATILKAPGPNYGMIGLFELTGVPRREVRGPRTHPLVGESVLVFYCADVPGKLTRLEEFGGMLLAPAAKFHLPGASFAPVTEVVFRDPDGFAVNLIEAPISQAYDTAPVSFG
jgi:catechol 2,3-dioxygenase-like lactoylglutathione lyase family enzyme